MLRDSGQRDAAAGNETAEREKRTYTEANFSGVRKL